MRKGCPICERQQAVLVGWFSKAPGELFKQVKTACSYVKTKQGEGRYCVLFEQNGQRSKFITNCYNLKDVLDQAREAENNGQKIFPVENVIVKRRSLGDGKSAYYFEE